MKYLVKMSDQSKADLRETFEYISSTLMARDAAANLIRKLQKAINGLDEFPFRFREYDKEPWKSRGLRVLPESGYIIFYIPNQENKTVAVIRIMYDGRDVDFQLENETDESYD